MPRLARPIALLLLVLVAPAFAQVKEDYNALNAKAVEALKAKKFDDGIAVLNHMLEVYPKDKGTAYNLACAHSLKGDVDKAFEWMDKGIDWGWGPGRGLLVDNAEHRLSEIDMVKTDPDLANLRKDARYAKVLDRMAKSLDARAAQMRKGAAYAANFAVYVPDSLDGSTAMPLLVVLHDAGTTKDDVVKGRWRGIADELGFALLAPSGIVPLGDDPAKGMEWYEYRDDYVQSPGPWEKSVSEALTEFQKAQTIDPARTVIVGEGQGGLVAMNVAIGAVTVYRGAVALNATIAPELLEIRGPLAARMGLRLTILEDATRMAHAPEVTDGLDNAIADMKQRIMDWGMQGDVKSFTPDPKTPDSSRKFLVEAIKASIPAARTPHPPPAAPAVPPK
jgi:predicted esterase